MLSSFREVPSPDSSVTAQQIGELRLPLSAAEYY
jgi:hypothetical protein